MKHLIKLLIFKLLFKEKRFRFFIYEDIWPDCRLFIYDNLTEEGFHICSKTIFHGWSLKNIDEVSNSFEVTKKGVEHLMGKDFVSNSINLIKKEK